MSFDFDCTCIRVTLLIQGWRLLNFFPSNVVLIRMWRLTREGAYSSKYCHLRDWQMLSSVKSLFLDCFRNSDGEQLQL